jgi:hypothetical protein
MSPLKPSRHVAVGRSVDAHNRGRPGHGLNVGSDEAWALASDARRAAPVAEMITPAAPGRVDVAVPVGLAHTSLPDTVPGFSAPSIGCLPRAVPAFIAIMEEATAIRITTWLRLRTAMIAQELRLRISIYCATLRWLSVFRVKVCLVVAFDYCVLGGRGV